MLTGGESGYVVHFLGQCNLPMKTSEKVYKKYTDYRFLKGAKNEIEFGFFVMSAGCCAQKEPPHPSAVADTPLHGSALLTT
jgi:hypothetical protein